MAYQRQGQGGGGSGLVPLTDGNALKIAKAEGMNTELAKVFFMQNRSGEMFIKKAGLLWKAERKFGAHGYSVAVEVPSADEYNMVMRMMGIGDSAGFCVIMKAVVRTRDNEYVDWGTAMPDNLPPHMHKYALEMASTRAQNRALRQATVCGFTSYEEMPTAELDDDAPAKVVPVAEVLDDQGDEPPVIQRQAGRKLTDEDFRDFNEYMTKLETEPWLITKWLREHGVETFRDITYDVVDQVKELAEQGHFGREAVQ